MTFYFVMQMTWMMYFFPADDSDFFLLHHLRNLGEMSNKDRYEVSGK